MQSPSLPTAIPSDEFAVMPFYGFPEEHRILKGLRNSKENFKIEELIKIRT